MSTNRTAGAHPVKLRLEWKPLGEEAVACYAAVRTMRIEALHLNMRVRHPQYGVGVVKRILEHTADILFDEGLRTVAPDTCGLQPGEAQAEVTGLEMPLNQFIREVVNSVIANLGLATSKCR